MSGSSRLRPYRRLTTLESLVVAGVVAALGIGLLYLAERDPMWAHYRSVQDLVSTLGSAVVVSVALGLLWELVGKRAFAREILETARTSTDIEAAGLARIGTRYLDDPDWEHYFRSVRKLDIYFAYGRTWRNVNLPRLQELASRADARIRVYLPDTSDPATVDELARRFDMAADQLTNAIEEARDAFLGLRCRDGAEVAVYYRPGASVFSCYRFDGTAIITLYTHSSRKRGDIPTLVCTDGGSLYDFVRDEFRAIHDQSTPVDHSNQPKEAAP